MLFSSIPFLYTFLPCVLILYFLVPGWLKNTVLLLSSLFFYAWGEPRFVVFMVIAIVQGYVFGLLAEKFRDRPKKTKLCLWASAVISLGLLGYCKYADFFISGFNTLTGLRQHTGNWPGKTVAAARGDLTYGGERFTLVDLPGTYSLFPNSAEEEIARDYLCSGEAEAVLILADATCLERSLNLVLQTLEAADVPAVVCVNLLDEAAKKGIVLDLPALSHALGAPVVGTAASCGEGLDKLRAALAAALIEELDKLYAALQSGDTASYLTSYRRDCLTLGREVQLLWQDVKEKVTALDVDDQFGLVVRRADGKLYGYNTDYMGFAHLCDAHGVNFAGRTVLILGTGGTHNTTSAVARDKGAAKVLTVSRHPDPEKGELSYAEAVSSGAQIVVNTTPAGMYPNVGVCNLDVAAMPDLEAVVDVVYNPDKTELILRAEEAGVPVAVGGLEMLVAQAVYAAEYFLDRKFEDAPVEIRRITAALRRDMLNIALIGMPSSGKTTLGRMLAKSLGRTFVDLDEEIVKTDGRSIPDIFAAEGEDGFRTKETAETQRFGKEGRQLISCGGGIVKKPENLRALHQNGIILFIDRPVDALAVGGGRPLSSSMDALRQMEAQRRPLYLAAADAVIPNNGTLDDALHAAMEALDEIFDS
mgnify:CR=1 FL=1